MLVPYVFLSLIAHFQLFVTDGIVSEILRAYLVKYEKQWDARTAHRIVGKTPLEAAAAVVEDYGLPLSIDEFISQINPMFSNQ